MRARSLGGGGLDTSALSLRTPPCPVLVSLSGSFESDHRRDPRSLGRTYTDFPPDDLLGRDAGNAGRGQAGAPWKKNRVLSWLT